MSKIDQKRIITELMKLTKEQIEAKPNSSVLLSMQSWHRQGRRFSEKQLTYILGLLSPHSKAFSKDDIHEFTKSLAVQKKGVSGLKTRYVGRNMVQLILRTGTLVKDQVDKIKRMDGFIIHEGHILVKINHTNIYLLKDMGFCIDSETENILPKTYVGVLKEIPEIDADLYPHQLDGVAFMQQRNGNIILADDMGVGKAAPLYSKVLTPTGFVQMRDVYVGMEIIGRSGKTGYITGVFPQGVKSVYKVTLSDGASTECCDEHLWAVNTMSRNKRKKPHIIKSLHEIQKCLRNGAGNRKWFIPIIDTIRYKKNTEELPINPYLLGILISEGGITRQVGFTSQENLIVYAIENLPPNKLSLSKYNTITYSISQKDGSNTNGGNAILNGLKLLKMYGKKAQGKFIPDMYKYASIEDRILLLQGIMDGDGECSKNHPCTVHFTTSSEQLAKDVQELIQSLGGITFGIKTRNAHIGEKEYSPFWGFTFRLPLHIKPFLHSSKAGMYAPQGKYIPCRAIKSIEYVGEKECQCISVSFEDKLYVTDDFIVTHNTLQTISFIAKNNLYPAFIVCPSSLKLNWKNEIEKWCKKSQDISVLHGTKGNVRDLSYEWNILNYAIVDGWKDAIIQKQETYAKKYQKNRYVGILVLDESHNIKNEDTKQTKACLALARVVPKGTKTTKKAIVKITNPNIRPRVICISGTPMLNRPIELYTAISSVAPAMFKNKFEYAMKYCGAEEGEFGWDYNGASNTEELHNLLTNTVMLRRMKKDVLKDLPSKQRIVVPIELSATYKKEYKRIADDFVKWLKEKRNSCNNKQVKAEAILKINYLKHEVAKAKLSTLIDWIDNFLEGDQKLVLFTTHIDILQTIHDKYKSISVILYGDTKMADRQLAVDKFQNDNNIRLFISTIKAGGVGITLTAASSVCFVELGWTPSEHDQCEDRCLRIGATADSVSCYYFVCLNTIEEKIIQMLDKKRVIINKVIEGNSHEEYELLGDLLDKMIKDNV